MVKAKDKAGQAGQGERGTPKTAVALLRVSKNAEIQRNGVDAQRTAITQWAARENVTIVEWLQEEVSGTLDFDRRDKLIFAIACVQTHRASYLIMHKTDRFARNTGAAILAMTELRRVNAALAFAEGELDMESPMGKLIATMQFAIAEFEAGLIAARTKLALAEKAKRGEAIGNAPFGYRIVTSSEIRNGKPVKMLVEDTREQSIISAIKELRARDGWRSANMSIRDIETELARRGIVGRPGAEGVARPLNRTTIHNIILMLESQTDKD